MSISSEEGASIGLSERQTVIVNLIEQRRNRAQIAQHLGVSKQTARDLIGGLCDFYGCPSGDVPGRVRDELDARLSASSSEISEAR